MRTRNNMNIVVQNKGGDASSINDKIEITKNTLEDITTVISYVCNS